MTRGLEGLPGLIVIEHDELVLKVLTEASCPGLDATGNYDFWMTPRGRGTYTGTFISPAGIDDLFRKWSKTGEYDNGAYFSVMHAVIVPDMTQDNLLQAALSLSRADVLNSTLILSE